MRKYIALVFSLVCLLGLVGCGQRQNISNENKDKPINGEQQETYNTTEESIGTSYTYEELSEMPAEELLDLFVQNGLVINDELKSAYTEEELQALFKENFHLWHTGVSAHSHTMYCELAEQIKVIYEKIAE